MSLYQRKGTPYWWYNFWIQGHRFRGSTNEVTRKRAELVEAIEKRKAIDEVILGKKTLPTLSVTQACGKYWDEYARHLKSGEKSIKYHQAHIIKHLGKDAMLNALADSDISNLVAKLRSHEGHKKGEYITPSSINRVLSTLRKMLSKAKNEWGLDVSNIAISKYMLEEPQARTRWITKEQAQHLMSELKPWVRPIIIFALLTGLRKSNVALLRWEQIDMNHRLMWVTVKSSKPGGKEMECALSQTAWELLRQMDPADEGYVFERQFKDDRTAPRVQLYFRKAWVGACKRANIKDFRFHDLRHTFASWLLQDGEPLTLIQELLGHEDIATTRKYAHHEQGEKRRALERIKIKLAQNQPHSETEGEIEMTNPLINMVGVAGFEPTTPSPPERLPTKKIHKNQKT